MLTYQDFQKADEALFLNMEEAFNATDAMLHPTSLEKRRCTFAAAVSEDPTVRGIFCFSDGVPAGYAVLSRGFSTDFGGYVLWVEEIFVDAAFRGQGIGRAFLEWITKTAAKDCALVRLEVAPENPRAAKLYEAMGFQTLAYRQYIRPQAGA